MLTNYREIDDLRQLKADDCLIVTKLDLMRGVDYHTPDYEVGIDLLIARDFPSTRAYEQGLGRVGRYSEPCTRYKWDMLPGTGVNKAEELALRGKIGNKINDKINIKPLIKTTQSELTFQANVQSRN